MFIHLALRDEYIKTTIKNYTHGFQYSRSSLQQWHRNNVASNTTYRWFALSSANKPPCFSVLPLLLQLAVLSMLFCWQLLLGFLFIFMLQRGNSAITLHSNYPHHFWLLKNAGLLETFFFFFVPKWHLTLSTASVCLLFSRNVLLSISRQLKAQTPTWEKSCPNILNKLLKLKVSQ